MSLWINEFLIKRCDINGMFVYMDGCYIDTLWGIQNLENNLIEGFIKNGITKVNSYMDMDLNSKSDCACIGYSESHHSWIGWTKTSWNEYKVGNIFQGLNVQWINKENALETINKGFKCIDLNDCKKCAFAFVLLNS